MLVDPAAGGDVVLCIAQHHAVADDLAAGGDIHQCDLVCLGMGSQVTTPLSVFVPAGRSWTATTTLSLSLIWMVKRSAIIITSYILLCTAQLLADRHHTGGGTVLVVHHLLFTQVILRGAGAVGAVVRSRSQTCAGADAVKLPALLALFQVGVPDAVQHPAALFPYSGGSIPSRAPFIRA